MFFGSFRIFFFRITRESEYLIYLLRGARIFFPEFNTRLYDKKTLNQIIFIFLHQNQNIFFSNIGNQNFFLEKNIPPLVQVKLSFTKGDPSQVHYIIQIWMNLLSTL
jgi:hypothetical protein